MDDLIWTILSSPAFDDHNVPIVLTSSKYYAPYSGVLIQSLIDHANADRNYDIIIFEKQIPDSMKTLLRGLADGCPNVSIRFANLANIVRDIDVERLEIDYPFEVYFKILAPYILNQYCRVIVMDSDMLVKRDIADLFAVNLDGCPLGAVPDLIWQGYCLHNAAIRKLKVRWCDYCRDTLTMKNPLCYVNSGLIVFNIEKYCAELPMETILNTAQSKRFFWVDQDVLNLLMEGRIKLLDMAWNVLLPINLCAEYVLANALEKSRKAYHDAYTRPFVLHWAGKPKPWVCPDVPYGDEWWSVAQRTPFMGHIIARMVDELQTRREYYQERYGQSVQSWDPMPDVKREF